MQPFLFFCIVCWVNLVGLNAVAGSPDDPSVSLGDQSEDASHVALNEGVVGRIVTVAGKGVAGAMIMARPLDSSAPPVPDMAAVSGAEGNYEWPLLPGIYELTVVADKYTSQTKRVTVRSRSVSTADFTLMLRR